MGMFAGMNLNQFHGSGGGNYFKDGDFVCRVQSMKVITKRDGHTAFIAEFEVLESNNDEIKVGSIRSFYVPLSDAQFKETSYGNMVDAMRAATATMMFIHGSPTDPMPVVKDVAISDEDADSIIAEDQPLAGAICGVRAYTIITKIKKQQFTKHEFFVPTNARDYAR
ncbi:MAG: hypothetical protein Q8S00_32425 [Deltaproteobacteria bacterium]|nr:hypothetical protein [Deltaproteobacteria bacterium]